MDLPPTTHSLETSAEEELTSVRKRHFVLAAGLGLGVGCIAVAFEWMASFVSRLQQVCTLSSTGVWENLFLHVLFCAGAGSLVGALTYYLAPEAGGSGIPHVKAVLAHLQPLRGVRVMLVKFMGGAIVIGSKFSLGREGPTVHIGASLADEVARRAKMPRHLRDHLIACGAGAGIAAAFNAPLAGFLFVIEELRREVNSITLGMALLGTVLADAIVQLGSGGRSMLRISEVSPLSLECIPAILLIAMVASCGGLLFNHTLVLAVVKVPSRSPLWVRGGLVGGVVGACITFVPTLVLDEQGIFDLFGQGASVYQISMVTLGCLFIGKLLLTVACYATGVPGGIFAPMLVQGALLGFLCSHVLTLTSLPMPTVEVSALIGMTAFFAASVRAPFTGVVLLAEMTNAFSLLLPLMLAALVGYFVGELLGARPIYERLLTLSQKERS